MMDIDSVMHSKSPSADARREEGIGASRHPVTSLQSSLDEISSQDLMEVDAQLPIQAPGASASTGLAQSQPVSPHGFHRVRPGRGSTAMQTTRKNLPLGAVPQVPGFATVPPVCRNFLLHAASAAARGPFDDAAGAVGMSPVPTPPVVVVTSSDVASWP